MSVPRIPGFTSRSESVADQFKPPAGDWPADLWPEWYLRSLTPFPTDWVVVLANHREGGTDFGVSSVLAQPAHLPDILREPSWSDSGLGSAGHWESGGETFFDSGLRTDVFDGACEFFMQRRDHHDLVAPTVEITLPFLWYFNAIPRGTGWSALDDDGCERPFIRIRDVSDNNYSVEVDAELLRRFLGASEQVLVTQHDQNTYSTEDIVSPAVATYVTDASHLQWAASRATWLRTGDTRKSHARLLGKVVIQPGTVNLSRDSDGPFEDFIIGVDPGSGQPIRHTCDRDLLGTYFDGPGTDRIHYLTPVNFRPEVLERYISEPDRYEVSATYLSCLNLWGVSISRNTEGLVEVYLGDLGRDIPAGERSHWLAFNIPPRGEMEPGRFQRDFLNVSTSSPDPIRDLRAAHERADEAFRERTGAPLWKPCVEPLESEFNHLHGPVKNVPSALTTPVLTLTKALVDSLDGKAVRAVTGTSAQGLDLLDEYVASLGGDPASIVGPLRSLQAIRSKGHAHRADTSRERLLTDLGLAELSVPAQFDALCGLLGEALASLAELITGSGDGPTKP